jgi:hypothetical protein
MAEETIYAKATSERKNGQKPQTIGYYDLDKALGEGNFAKVRLANHSLTGQRVSL